MVSSVCAKSPRLEQQACSWSCDAIVMVLEARCEENCKAKGTCVYLANCS